MKSDYVEIIETFDAAQTSLQGGEAYGGVAVQVHLDNIDLIDEMLDAIKEIPVPFDCFVSTDTDEKGVAIRKRFLQDSCAQQVFVEVIPHRDAGLFPMLEQVSSVIHRYEYICHIRADTFAMVEFGDAWRQYLLHNLLGSSVFIAAILKKMNEDPTLGMVFPSPYPLLENGVADKPDEAEALKLIGQKLGIDVSVDDIAAYPAGAMFWARTKALAPLFAANIAVGEFFFESGQTGMTMLQATGKALPCLVQKQGFKTLVCQNAAADKTLLPKRRLAVYLHFNATDNDVELEDMFTIKALHAMGCEVVLLSNTPLGRRALRTLARYTIRVVQRDNAGYDFGAWKEYLLDPSSALWVDGSYDELILLNNSCIGPIFSLAQVFASMEGKEYDFWGLSAFPHWDDMTILDPSDDGTGYIPEHIQSYFLVFTRSVFMSEAFKQLWKDNKPANTYVAAIRSGELVLTKTLHEAGFSYGVYTPESLYAPYCLGTLQPQNELGWEYALLGAPMLKKKNRALLSESRRDNLLSLLDQLNVSPSIKRYFQKPGKAGRHFPGKRTLVKIWNTVKERRAGF